MEDSEGFCGPIVSGVVRVMTEEEFQGLTVNKQGSKCITTPKPLAKEDKKGDNKEEVGCEESVAATGNVKENHFRVVEKANNENDNYNENDDGSGHGNGATQNRDREDVGGKGKIAEADKVFIVDMLVVGLVRIAFRTVRESMDGGYIEYELEVYVGEKEKCLVLIKRYTDFELLRRALSKNWYVPALFPRKQMFTGMGAWKDPVFLQDRQNQLALWVNSMLAVFQGQDINIIPEEVVHFFA